MSHSKIVLITGATAGIGRHAALHLARKGHRVIATGRKQAVLDELLREAAGTALEVLRLDVTDAASIAEASAEVLRRTAGHGVDVLINNAGYGLAAPLEEVTDEDLRAQYETNVFGLMAVTRAFLPRMRERGDGRILNVSSIGGRYTFPLFGAYNSTKYAVESLSDALRCELGPFGIDVVLIEPGPIKTNFADRTMESVRKYSRADSPYAPVYERADLMRERTDAQSAGPEAVTKVIERAIVSRRPRARYVAPGSMAVFLAVMALLPTRLTDWAMSRMIGLTKKQLEAPRAQAVGATS
jgi:NAD(P)-dependent dehydrogenase (short-subunit alcohol dehydrogenase family)